MYYYENYTENKSNKICISQEHFDKMLELALKNCQKNHVSPKTNFTHFAARHMFNDVDMVPYDDNQKPACSSRPDYYNDRYNYCMNNKLYGGHEAVEYCSGWMGCL